MYLGAFASGMEVENEWCPNDQISMMKRPFTLIILPFLPYQMSIKNAMGDNYPLPLLNQIRLYQFVCIDTVAAKKRIAFSNPYFSASCCHSGMVQYFIETFWGTLYNHIIFISLHLFSIGQYKGRREPNFSILLTFTEISIANVHVFGLWALKIDDINVG